MKSISSNTRLLLVFAAVFACFCSGKNRDTSADTADAQRITAETTVATPANMDEEQSPPESQELDAPATAEAEDAEVLTGDGCAVDEDADCFKNLMQTLRKGTSRCATGYDFGAWPVYNQEDLKVLWATFFSCDPSAPALPTVDFDRELILLLHLQSAYEGSYDPGYVRDVAVGGGSTNLTMTYDDNSCAVAQKIKYADAGSYVLPKEETAFIVLRIPATGNQISASFSVAQQASCP